MQIRYSSLIEYRNAEAQTQIQMQLTALDSTQRLYIWTQNYTRTTGLNKETSSLYQHVIVCHHSH